MMRCILILLAMTLSSTAQGFEGCYMSDLPYASSPGEVKVYFDEASFSNATGDFGAGPMSLADGKRAIHRMLARHNSDSGGTYYFRWMDASPPNGYSCPLVPDSDAPMVFLSMGPEAYVCPGHNCGAAALGYFSTSWSPELFGMNCGFVKFREDVGWSHDGSTGNDLYRVFGHELMHVMRHDHSDVPICAGRPVVDHIRVPCSGAVCPTSTDHSDRILLPYSDKRAVREDMDYATDVVREYYGNGFGPQSWSSRNVVGATLSPISTTDGDDSFRGYAYVEHRGTNAPKAVVTLYEGAWSNTIRVSGYNSYNPPDITRSLGQATDRWMVAFLVGETGTDSMKDIRIAERNLGGSSWNWQNVAPIGANNTTGTTRNSVAAAFDPRTDRFIVVYNDDARLSGGNGRDRVHLITRSMVRTDPWVDTLLEDSGGSPVVAFEAPDVACSKWTNTDGHNCVAVYVDRSASGTIHIVPFHVRSYGVDLGSIVAGDPISKYYYGFGRPSVTVNPLNADPKFYFAFEQGGTTTYTRKMNRNTYSWISGTALGATGHGWLGPVGLGSFVWGTTPYTTGCKSQSPGRDAQQIKGLAQ